MKPFDVDIPVLILFFNRPDNLKKVFASVKSARPSRLFLYQDGPRGEQDLPLMEACRAVVEDVDWECDVRKNYQEKNSGCDPSGYLAQKWAFSLSDKCVILEDDVVPSVSFFRFCKEMLDRYEKDERVVMVSGFNTDGISQDVVESYFFTSVFSIWGWASWRRVVDKWDPGYSIVKSKERFDRLKDLVKERNERDSIIRMLERHSREGKPYFESIFWSYMLENDGLAVMPKNNMINNVGFEGESTHYNGTLACMPRDIREQFLMKRFDVDFPLVHPAEISDHSAYKKRHYRRNGWGYPLIKIRHSLEELRLNLIHGNFKFIGRSILLRVKKTIGI